MDEEAYEINFAFTWLELQMCGKVAIGSKCGTECRRKVNKARYTANRNR